MDPPELLVGMAFTVFEQLAARQKQVLKAASTIEGAFGLDDLQATLPEIDQNQLSDICEELSQRNLRAFRRVPPSRSDRLTGAGNERFQFYSRVLRHASSTLVLERQRIMLRQRTTQSRTTQIRRFSSVLLGMSFSDIEELSDYSGEESDISETFATGSQGLQPTAASAHAQ